MLLFNVILSSLAESDVAAFKPYLKAPHVQQEDRAA